MKIMLSLRNYFTEKNVVDYYKEIYFLSLHVKFFFKVYFYAYYKTTRGRIMKIIIRRQKFDKRDLKCSKKINFLIYFSKYLIL